jgi:hypothetical protein
VDVELITSTAAACCAGPDHAGSRSGKTTLTGLSALPPALQHRGKLQARRWTRPRSCDGAGTCFPHQNQEPHTRAVQNLQGGVDIKANSLRGVDTGALKVAGRTEGIVAKAETCLGSPQLVCHFVR